MKTTIPFASFDLQSLLNTVADFTDAVCGEQFQAATLATESEREELYDQDWDSLPDSSGSIVFPSSRQSSKTERRWFLILPNRMSESRSVL